MSEFLNWHTCLLKNNRMLLNAFPLSQIIIEDRLNVCKASSIAQLLTFDFEVGFDFIGIYVPRDKLSLEINRVLSIFLNIRDTLYENNLAIDEITKSSGRQNIFCVYSAFVARI